MKLHELKKSPGSTHRRLRKGLGPGSTLGKTAGRGQKGQYARSTVNRHFEGGQTPLYRRLPRRGFNNSIFRQEFRIVNLGDLAIPGLKDKATIGVQDLVDAGAIRGGDLPVKVLADGELKRAITLTAHKFSKAAEEKLKAAGGQAIMLFPEAAPAAPAPARPKAVAKPVVEAKPKGAAEGAKAAKAPKEPKAGAKSPAKKK